MRRKLFRIFIAGWIFGTGTFLTDAEEAHAEALSDFSKGYATSASLVCRFREGPLLNMARYQKTDETDLEASIQGMRSFFVTLYLFGKFSACEHAISVYGPRGTIRTGLLLF